jgi:hypothetical protein
MGLEKTVQFIAIHAAFARAGNFRAADSLSLSHVVLGGWGAK